VELSGKGALSWSSRATGVIIVLGEKTEALNAISGQTQCVLSSTISSVTGVWKADINGNKTGSNLYSFFNGRTIDLITFVSNGTDLIVDYRRAGSVKNYLRGTSEGVSRIDVSMDVDSEEGLSQTVRVTITKEELPTVPPPPVPPPPGTVPPLPPSGKGITYECFIDGPTSHVSTIRPGETDVHGIGPYFVRMNVYNNRILQNTLTDFEGALSASGTGFLQFQQSHLVYYKASTPTQTITINGSGRFQDNLNGFIEVRGNASLLVAFTGTDRFY